MTAPTNANESNGLKNLHISNRIHQYLLANRAGLTVIGLAWLIFFAPILSSQQVYFLDDLKTIFYPLEIAYAQAQSNLSLPVWSNLFGFGQPLLAWSQLGFFTPLHLILRALNIPPLNLLQISVATYFAAGTTGMFMLLRRFALPQAAAALGAILFTYSGFNIGHLNHVNFYTATMVLPWLLIAIHSFLRKPTLRRSALMSILVATLLLSAHPQVTLLCLSIALLFGLLNLPGRAKSNYPRIIGLTLLAAVVAAGLGSFTLLPLQEFVPQTERGEVLPEYTQLDFSYAPSHAITLVLPYFFGDHTSYWGAKGFQELAAYVGLLPLLLAGLALYSWRRHRRLKLFGILLILIGATLALGKYSPIYRWLIENRVLTFLNIPGRFVLLVDVGLAILAALGLTELAALLTKPRRQRITQLALALLLPIIAITPFLVRSLSDRRVEKQLANIIGQPTPGLLLAILGLVLFLFVTLLPNQASKRYLWLVTIVAAATLLIVGLPYNPLVPKSAVSKPPFAGTLNEYTSQTGIPPRLYTRDRLLADLPEQHFKTTDPISPLVTIHQPVTLASAPKACFQIPLHARDTRGAKEFNTSLTLSLRQSLTDKPLASIRILSRDIQQNSDQRVCFTNDELITESQYFLTFASDHDSGITLQTSPTDQPSAYIVRLASPTGEQLAQSQKKLVINLKPDLAHIIDRDVVLLPRHLQLMISASSARWVGALTTANFRYFVDEFLANDSDEIVLGDGRHVLEYNRRFFDLAGVTHFIQEMPNNANDTMTKAGFTIEDEFQLGDSTYRLYNNPAAFPKAYLVNNHVFAKDTEDIFLTLNKNSFEARREVIIEGEQANLPQTYLSPTEKLGSAKLSNYTDRQVDVQVSTPNDAWLIITDTTSPQWRTLIDGQPAQHYTAYGFYKAARVPAGQHTVSFQYLSPAIERAKILTSLALLAVVIMIFYSPSAYRALRKSHVTEPPQTS